MSPASESADALATVISRLGQIGRLPKIVSLTTGILAQGATDSSVMHATWHRCRVHFMRNVMAHAGKSDQRMVSALLSAAVA